MEIVIKKPTVPGAEKPGCEHPPTYRGKPGPQGPAGTIEIAQVVTIEPSDPARVENIGDSTNAKLILYIPKGDPGNRGEPGPAVEITEDIIQAITNELDLTPALVGLGNVDNTSDMDKPLSNAQIEVFSLLALEIGDHVGNKNNPHGVTIEQIGAAPAGYGLGKLTGKWCEDCNAATENGFYSLAGPSTKNAPPNYVNYGNMLVINRSNNNHITQIAFYLRLICIRSYAEGVWSGWEWVNPPMVLGVEYRTTKRHNNKVVYAKAFSIGALPNNTATGFSISGATEIVTAYGHGKDTATGTEYPFPIFGYSDGKLTAMISHRNTANNIYIKTFVDYSGYSGVLTVEYTKD